MTNRKLILLIAIIIVFFQHIDAQDYYFRHYQVENGLSNNAVICSLQDRKGFLWFGTKDGLNRFDGYTFKVFRSNPDDTGSIGSNFIHCLFEDHEGRLWVGTERGLYLYDATTESFTLVPNTANQYIRDVLMDKQDNLWFITGFTLTQYNAVKKKLKYYNVTPLWEATSMCMTPDGIFWVATSSGLLKKYNPVTDSFADYNVFQHSKAGVYKWIEKIYSSNNGFILIGTSNQGAKLFNPRSGDYKDILTYNQDKTGIFVRNFIQTATDKLWIATESGIFIYNLKTGVVTNLKKRYNDPYSISDNAVYTFSKDQEGGIWTGTYFGGINYYPKQYTPFKKYFPKTDENSLSGNVVREIHQDKAGNLWIGTEDAGLNKLNTATGKFTHFQPTATKGSISYTNIHGLLITNNKLWIGTFEHGLDVMDIPTEKVVRHYEAGTGEHALKSNFIYCIYQTNDGEIMLGTTRGAYQYNRREDNFSLLPGMTTNNWYTSILKDHEGILWAGTYGDGVNYYNTKTGTSGKFRYNAKNKNSISSDRVNTIFEDSDHTLWFATEGGLCKYNRNTNDFKRYTTQDGFPSNFFLSILEDDDKNLWISTSKGLASFNLKTEKITVYTKENGILNDQFNFNSAYKDPAGTMYFGSVKGLISFRPDAFKNNTFIPPIYITGFQVHNKEVPIASSGSPLKKSITNTDKITLLYDQSTFSIDFAALSYTAPDMPEYAYQMEGLDKNWTYLKTNRKAYFTELSPGTYLFKVKASNSSGVWNQQETRLAIKILPPWWASIWAYSLYGIIMLILIYYIIHSYHKRTEEKNRRKMELLEIAKEKEVYEAKIEFFTNVAHEIRTPLTLIKGPLEKVIKRAGDIPDIKNSLKIMEKNTNRLIDLTNELLDFRQTELKGFSLNFVKANITELIEDAFASFKIIAEQKNVTITTDLPSQPLIASVDVEAFQKILTNLFSNAVKYAESKVHISLLPFNEQENTFTLEVKNDGHLIPYNMREKIFEPFFRLKETQKQKGTGIGLALSRSLAELHEGTLYLIAPQNDMNVFALTLPIHQEKEFNLYNTIKNYHRNK